MIEKQMPNNQDGEARCACLQVEYRPAKNQDGTVSERWVCDSCGARFERFKKHKIKVSLDQEVAESLELLLNMGTAGSVIKKIKDEMEKNIRR